MTSTEELLKLPFLQLDQVKDRGAHRTGLSGVCRQVSDALKPLIVSAHPTSRSVVMRAVRAAGCCLRVG